MHSIERQENSSPSKDLDYERKSSYHLQILARDRAADFGQVNTATAAILVRVEDVADQPPVFVSVPGVTRIAEDAPRFTQVGRTVFGSSFQRSRRDRYMKNDRQVRRYTNRHGVCYLTCLRSISRLQSQSVSFTDVPIPSTPLKPGYKH